MKNILPLIIFLLTFTSCSAQDEVNFSEQALADVFVTLENEETTFAQILERHAGKKILIDIWATWCRDCIVGFPKLKEVQKNHPDIAYVFLSLDRNQKDWKKGIKRYRLNGDHYFVPKGWKSDFCGSIDLDWVPRYIVVGEDGKMELFKAIKADDPSVAKVLK